MRSPSRSTAARFSRAAARLASLALLAAALFVAPALTGGGAHAQSVLVSNTGEAATSNGSSHIFAQSFETGDNAGGYTLSEIQVGLRTLPSTIPASLIKLFSNSSGAPGSEVATLTNPATMTANSVNTFTAPANTTLAANTIYWVMVNDGLDSGRVTIGFTESDDETSAASGWSIGDTALWKSTATATSWSPDPKSLRIAVNGAVKVQTGPAITSITSDLADETYSPFCIGVCTVSPDQDPQPSTWDGVIKIKVVFDAAVTVTGTPTLSLANTGNASDVATYASGSGGTELVFNWDIPAGRAGSDISVSAVNLAGGTIAGSAGHAVLTLPSASNLADNKTIDIDSKPPGTFAVRVLKGGENSNVAGIGENPYGTGDTVWRGNKQYRLTSHGDDHRDGTWVAHLIDDEAVTTCDTSVLGDASNSRGGRGNQDINFHVVDLYTTEHNGKKYCGSVADEYGNRAFRMIYIRGIDRDHPEITVSALGAGNKVSATAEDGACGPRTDGFFSRCSGIDESKFYALPIDGTAACDAAAYTAAGGTLSDYAYTGGNTLTVGLGKKMCFRVHDRVTDFPSTDGRVTYAASAEGELVLSSMAVTSDPGSDGTYGIGDAVEATVTFTGAVDLTVIPMLEPTLDINVGGKQKTLTYSSGSGSAALVFTGYTVAEGDEDADGIAIGEFDPQSTFFLSPEGTVLQADQLAWSAVPSDSGHKVDGVRPALDTAVADGATITLTFDEDLDAAAGRTPPNARFSVTADGTAAPLGTAVPAVSGKTVTLTLATAVTDGQAVVVTYTDETANDDTAVVQDAAGNDAAGFTTGQSGAPAVVNALTNIVACSAASMTNRIWTGNVTVGDVGDTFTGFRGTAGGLDTTTFTYGGTSYTIDALASGSKFDGRLSISLDRILGDDSLVLHVGGDGPFALSDATFYSSSHDYVWTLGDAYPRLTVGDQVCAALTGTVPGPPSGLSATAASAAQVDLGWTAPTTGGPVTGYEVEFATAATGPWSDADTVDGTSYEHAGRAPGTEYHYRVRAVNEAGASAWSPTASATTTTSAPSVTNIAFTSDPGSDDTYSIGDAVQATVTFTGAVDVTGTPQLEINVGGTPKTLSYSSGSTSAALVFTGYTVAKGDGDANGISVDADSVTLNSGTITENGDNTVNAVLTHTAVADDSGHKVDGVQPKLDTATPPATSADGATITLTFDEGLDAASGRTPPNARFSVTVDGTAAPLGTAAPAVSGRTVTLTLATAVTSGQAVVVTYTDETANDDTAVVQDAAGNDAAGFTTGQGGAPAVVNAVPGIIACSAASMTNRIWTGNLTVGDIGNTFTGLHGTTGGLDTTTFTYGGASYTIDALASGSNLSGRLAFGLDKALGGVGLVLHVGGDGPFPFSEATVDHNHDYIWTLRDAYPRLTVGDQVCAALTGTVPGPPSGLSATAASAAQVDLGWTAPTTGGPVTGYEVEFATAATGPWSDADTVDGTSYEHTGRAPGTEYHYRVRAVNEAGASAWSPTASATTTMSAPSITSITSDLADETYSPFCIGVCTVSPDQVPQPPDWDGVIKIKVVFDAAVTVTGTPTLSLANTGNASDVATYASGSGGTELVFHWDIPAGRDGSDISVSAVNLAGGTIADSGGNAVLTLPSGSNLADNKTINVDSHALNGDALELIINRAGLGHPGPTIEEPDGTGPTTWRGNKSYWWRHVPGHDYRSQTWVVKRIDDENVTTCDASVFSSSDSNWGGGSDRAQGQVNWVAANLYVTDHNGKKYCGSVADDYGNRAFRMIYIRGIDRDHPEITVSALGAGNKVSATAEDGACGPRTDGHFSRCSGIDEDKFYALPIDGTATCDAAAYTAAGGTLADHAYTGGNTLTLGAGKKMCFRVHDRVTDFPTTDGRVTYAASTVGVPPAVSSVAVSSAPAAGQNQSYKIGDAVEATVTFTGAVDVDTTSGTPQLEINVGGTPKTLTYSSGSGSAALVFTGYTVAEGDEDTDGIAIAANKLSRNGGAIREKDSTTVNAVLTHMAVLDDFGHRVDGVRPTITTLVYERDGSTGIIQLEPSEQLDAPDAILPPDSGFSIGVSSGTPPDLVSFVSIVSFLVSMTVQPRLESGVEVTLSYTPPTGPGAKLIRDRAGNTVDGFTNRAVVRRAQLDSVALSDAGADGAYAIDDAVSATVTFTAAVDVDTTSGTPTLEINVGGTPKTLAYSSGSGSAALVFTGYTVAEGDGDTDGIAIGADKLRLNGGTIVTKDHATLDAYITHDTVADDSGHKVDGVRPKLDTATPPTTSADGATITLTFDEDLDAAAGRTPPNARFSVTADGTAAPLGATAPAVSGKTVTLTLATAVTSGQAVVVTYTDETANDDTAVVQDTAGNDAATFPAQTVTNNVALGTLVLNLDAIATDDTVNIAEKAAGFTISGDTGTEADVSVTVTVGTTELTATSGSGGAWSVSVPGAAAYITGTSVTVTVSASKTGYTPPSDVTRTLAVDLTAPTAPSYTAPTELKVGVAITAMSPSGGADIDEYAAAGLPSGLGIDAGTGVISGTPDTADASTTSVTVTVEDTAGNPADVSITFPAVAKGDQTLSGFAYSLSTATLGGAAPTLTAPSGAQTTLSYSASPSTVCTVDSSTGALTLVGPGECDITVTAESDANYNQATDTFTVTVQPAGTLALNLDAIATDDTVNIAEKAAGFTISGDTGTEADVSVTVTVGTTELTATSGSGGAWSVSVPGAAAYITGTSVTVTVSASKTGYTPPSDVTRTLAVDLTAPTAPGYTAPTELKVGVAITAMSPSGGADIDEYAAAGLPSGLGIDAGTGVISGTPDTADASTTSVTVTVEDTAGNPADVSITFPAVAKGDQTLSGFAYSLSTATLGGAAPTLTAPSGAQTTLSYSATPSTVCTVDSSTGALTLVGPGECDITVTAESDANYNQATDTFTVTVQPAGTLALNLDAIAGDDTVNIAEKAAGFTISGDTGTEADVSVTVTVGTTELTATSGSGGAWSVSVPGAAAYITGTSVTVTVSASKTGYTPPSDVTRTLKVDGVRPKLDTATPPTTSADGATITLTFDEDLDAASGRTPPNARFSVTVDGTAAPLGTAAPAVSGRTVTLTLATAVTSGQAVVVAYTDETANDDTAVVQDAAGNDAAGFTTGQGGAPAVVNAVPGEEPPSITSITSDLADETYSPFCIGVCTVSPDQDPQPPTWDGVIKIKVVFDAAVTVTGTPTLSLANTGNASDVAAYVSGSGGTELVFHWDIPAGRAGSDISVSAVNLAGGTITGTAGNAVLTLPSGSNLADNKTINIDSRPPPNFITRITRADSSNPNDHIGENANGTGNAVWRGNKKYWWVANDGVNSYREGTWVAHRIDEESVTTCDASVLGTASNSRGANGNQDGINYRYVTLYTTEHNGRKFCGSVADEYGNRAFRMIYIRGIDRDYPEITVSALGTGNTVSATAEDGGCGPRTDGHFSRCSGIDEDKFYALPIAGTATCDAAAYTAAGGTLADHAYTGGNTLTVGAGKKMCFRVHDRVTDFPATDGRVTYAASTVGATPAVSSVAVSSAPAAGQNQSYKIGDAVEATVTFTGAVDVDTTSGTPELEINVGGTPKTLTYSSGSGSAALVFTGYTVAEGDEDTDGIAIAANKLSRNGGAIREKDSTTVNAVLTHTAVLDDSGHKVDGVRPTIETLGYQKRLTNTNGSILLEPSEPLQVSGILAADAGFSIGVSSGTTPNFVGALTITNSLVGLVVKPPLESGVEVTLSYTPPTGPEATPLRDWAGNTLDGFTNRAVVRGAQLDSVALSDAGADGAYAIGDAVSATVTFSRAVDVDTTSGTPTLEIDVGGTPETLAYSSGSGSAALVFTGYTVAEGDGDANGIAIGVDKLSRNGGAIVTKDHAGLEAQITHDAVADDSGHKVDGVRPKLDTATPPTTSADGATITLTFDEDLDAAAGRTPPNARFSVTVDGTAAPLGATAPAVSGKTVTLTLATAVTSGQAVVVTYTDETANDDTAVVQDTAGNDAATFPAQTVTNNVALGTLVLNLDAIATDDTVNIAEKAAGFTISGDTGTEADVSVTVTVGTTELTATSGSGGAWSVSVPGAAAYITGTSVTVTVSASKTGYTPPSDVTRTLAVDLTAPTAPSYTAPTELKVGVAITAMSPSGGADIDEYAAAGLPSGLGIDAGTGVISGTPDTADASTTSVTVTVEDTAGNPADVSITFPAVAKGDQTLSGFAYSLSTATLGGDAPTLTAPSGAQTTLSYSATPSTVCTVDSSTGALTLVGPGECDITVTAESDANYNQATDTFTVTVQPAGTLALNLDAIATDDTVNIAEKAAGFTISGDTGTEADVSVTVTVGTTELTATSGSGGAWSVSVPPAATYITGTSVTVTVSASKTGYTPPSDVTRTLKVDGVRPKLDTTTPPTTSADGATITLTFDEDLDAASGRTPPNARFSVTVDGTPAPLGTAAPAVSGKTVTLTLATAVTGGQAVAVTYTDETANDDTAVVQDAAGNDAATFPAQTVTNNPPATITVGFKDQGAVPFYSFEEGQADAKVTVEARATGGAPPADFTVTVTTHDRTGTPRGVATGGTDYTALARTLTFAADAFTADGDDYVRAIDVAVAVAADEVIEKTEEFTIEIGASGLPANISVPVAEATVEIRDTTAAANVTLHAPERIDEGESAAVEVRVDKEVAFPWEVVLATGDDTATTEMDFSQLSDLVRFQNGQRTATVTVETIEDQIVEGDETFRVQISFISTPAGLQLADGQEELTGTITITDDDVAQWTVTVAPGAINEDGGEATLTVGTGPDEVTFPEAKQIAIGLTGTATEGTDYDDVSDALTLPVGDHEVSTTIRARTDTTAEGNETVLVDATIDVDGTATAIGTRQTLLIAEAELVESVALSSSAGSDDTYKIDDAVEATVTFTGAVDVTGTPTLEIDVGGTPETLSYGSGSGSAELVFTGYTVAEGDGDANGIAIGADKLTLNGGTIRNEDTTTVNAVLTHTAVADDSGHKVDGVRPKLDTATAPTTSADGATITLTFDEDLDAASGRTPPNARFSVTVDGTAAPLGTAVPAVSGKTVTLTLATAVTDGQAVVVTYTDETANDDTAVVQDAAGNDAAGFTTGQGDAPAVVNAVPGVPPSACGTLPPLGENTDGSETVWSACMTVGIGDDFSSVSAGYERLANLGALTSRTFSHDGNNFYFDVIGTSTNPQCDTDVRFTIQSLFSGGWDEAENSWELRVGSHTFSFADTYLLTTQQAEWCIDSGVDLGFTQGAEINMEIREPSVPGAPASVTATELSTSAIRLAWSEPSMTGGSEITGYEYRERDGTIWGPWTPAGDATNPLRQDVTGLASGTTYGFQLRAKNIAGDGPASDTVEATTQAGRILTGENADGSQTLWSATLTVHAGTGYDPAGAGYYGINNQGALTSDEFRYAGDRFYFTYVGTIARSSCSSGSGFIIFGSYALSDWREAEDSWELRIGSQTLSFADTVVQTQTQSVWCDVSSGDLGFVQGEDVELRISKLNAPGAPGSLTATTLSSNSIALTWGSPLKNGGADVTGYKVQSSSDGNEPWTEVGAPTVPSFTHIELTAATTYHYRVLATNSIGDGDPSDAVEAQTAAGPIVSSTNDVLVSNTGRATSGSRQIRSTTWRAQPFDTGTHALGYNLESIGLDFAGAWTGTGTLQVTVRTDASGSPSATPLYTLSNPATFANGVNTFSAPDGAALDAGTTYWVAVTYNSADGPFWWRALLSAGLDSGTAAGWDIDAANKESTDSGSTWVAASPPVRAFQMQVNGSARPIAPRAPVGFAATGADGSVNLSWADPVDVGSHPVTNFQYRYGTGGRTPAAEGADWTDVPDSGPGEANRNSYTIPNLTNDLIHTFELRAVNAGGAGKAASVQATPRGSAGAVHGSSMAVVSNIGQPTQGDAASIAADVTYTKNDDGHIFETINTMGYRYVQTFATGGDGGLYKLDSVDVEFKTAGSGAHDVMQVSLVEWDVHTRKGTRWVGDFEQKPAEAGVTRFRYLGKEGLRASTAYAIRIAAALGTGTTATLAQTSEGAEDAGGLAGWTLGDFAYQQNFNVQASEAWSVNASGFALQVRINARKGAAATGLYAHDAEVNEAHGATLDFKVTLDPAPETGQSVTVAYYTRDNSVGHCTYDFYYAYGGRCPTTARAPDDYVHTEGTLTFAAGETLKTVQVPVVDDTDEDSGEGVELILHRPQGSKLARDAALGIIYDDGEAADPSVVSVGSPAATEALGATLDFVVRLSAPATGTVTMDYATVDGTATAGNDYTHTEGTLVFVAGETEKTVSAPVLVDNVDEGDETVTLTLDNLRHAVFDGYPTVVRVSLFATGTIRDPGSAQAQAEPVAGAQALAPLTAAFQDVPREHDGEKVFTFRVLFSEAIPTSYRVLRDQGAFRVTGGTVRRARRVDGRDDLREIHVKPDGWDDVTVVLPPTTDCEARGAVCMDDGRRLSVGNAATVRGPIAIDVADATVTEGPGATLDFVVTLSRASSETVTVDYATADGTAKAGDDYTKTEGTLTFAAGVTERTVAVPVLDDAVDDGGETMKLLLSDAEGARIRDGEAVGRIENSDAIPQAWLARFGRTVADHVVDAVGSRFADPRGGGSHVTLGGKRIALDGAGGGAAPEALAEREAAQGLASFAERMAGASDDGAPGANAWTLREEDGLAGSTETMSERELLLGSSFHLALGAGGEDTVAGDTRWTAWGRAASSRFDGEADGLRLDGEVTTFTLGADAAWSRWLAGVAVSLSEGAGSYRDQGDGDRGSGELESSLTGVHPYARLELSERLSLWGVLGFGSGALTLEMDGKDGERFTTDTGQEMAAVGARGVLVAAPAAGGLELAVRTDAVMQRMTSSAATGPGGGNLAGTHAQTSRVRLMLEGSHAIAVGEAGRLVPTLEVGLRQDGGDAETGTGIEMGAGLRWTDPATGLAVEAKLRGLVAHEDADYSEWGASGSVRIEPGADGRGLSLTLAPAWGAVEGGAERLWSHRDARAFAPENETQAGSRLEAELGYGFSVLGGRAVATPWAGMTRSETGETLRLGQRLKMGPSEWRLETEFADDSRRYGAGWGYRLGGALDLTVEAMRREAANDDAPEHEAMLRARMRW